MSSTEQRLEYLGEANDVLRMRNHVLATALKDLICSSPSDMANDAVEFIQLAFEDVLAELSYEDSLYTDLPHDVICAFLREKDH